VLVGLTEISEIVSYIIEDGDYVPCEGKLFYSGINVEEIVQGFLDGTRRFGFEETSFLLLFGHLPNEKEFAEFTGLMEQCAALPENFLRDTIMIAPSKDIMNSLSKSVLTLYAYDENPDDISIANVIRQSVNLIAQFPQLAIYGYQSYAHTHKSQSLVIHTPSPGLSIAENLLHMLRPDSKYTKLEAEILDIALMLHAEHGGGNNSTFTTHVVTSSHTDTYSAIAAALGSLKGPRHGGANGKVVQMFQDIQENVKDWNDDDAITAYLEKLLGKEAFDRAGLIYGMGHAVYSLSDPTRAYLQAIRRAACQREGPRRRVSAVLQGRGACPGGNRQDAPHLQGRKRQHRLLLRLRLQYARSSAGAVHPAFRRGAYLRLVRPPHRGACQRGQDYPPGVQVCGQAEVLHAHGREGLGTETPVGIIADRRFSHGGKT